MQVMVGGRLALNGALIVDANFLSMVLEMGRVCMVAD